MENFSGKIFSGEFDHGKDMFYLTQVKNLQTTSILSEQNLTQLNHYLSKQTDSCMITINDQMPILLKEPEVAELLLDLTRIMNGLKA
ncbi:hypothetical protein [Oceanobacillus massiliensis]|uniref:hypothetical protein n=1 Tax=Oceanobacillus massiliensis TaxID=1465765 RepID=UPI00028A3355|nr:hypothetical protein [Oceanobacillus massiliensis]